VAGETFDLPDEDQAKRLVDSGVAEEPGKPKSDPGAFLEPPKGVANRVHLGIEELSENTVLPEEARKYLAADPSKPVTGKPATEKSGETAKSSEPPAETAKEEPRREARR
jgi:hypothetical protein